MLGKLVRLLQPDQARPIDMALLVLIAGKLVRLEQPHQALAKFVTADVLMPLGNEVKLAQALHALFKLIAP